MAKKVAVVVLVVLVAVPAGASHAPVRSGRIISGVLTTSPSWSCAVVPDCLAWRASGCNPALAGRDPAWLASIEDVRTIARSRREFRLRPADPAGLVLGGASVEFFRRDCSQISWINTFWSSDAPYGDTITLTVPADAAWMTVTANDNVNVEWTLW